MKIKWLGHATFLITSEKGTKIITDPYITGSNNLHYGEIQESADVVTVSHDHFDHNNVAAVDGNPEVYRTPSPRQIKDVKLNGVATYHDTNAGRDRGPNMITCMEVDGIKVCHLGDLGHELDQDTISKVGPIDILLTPVGGFFTIDAGVATKVSRDLKPKVIIPMHFQNKGCSFPVSPVDSFLQEKQNITKENKSEVTFRAETLPSETQIIVLEPAL